MRIVRIYNITFILITCLLVSCAHKSGRSKRQHSYSNNKVDVVSTRNGNNIERNQKVTLDGSTIFKKYNTAVFMVFLTNGSSGKQGSGFFINNSGLAVSNYHVFSGMTIGEEEIKLANSNRVYKVSSVIKKDEDKDFIVFQVDISSTNYIPIAKSRPNVGDKVYAIGSPYGLENTFSSGNISQLRNNDLYQISIPIDHGSSGGALINEYGEVVGITSGSFVGSSQADLNYAWSIDVIKPYL